MKMPTWDEMSPRERDALVAEKVMNWKCDDRHCDGTWIIRCGACGRYGHGNCYGDGTGAIQIRCNHCPPYTQDISTAWEVVQKLKPTHSCELRVGKFAESARFTQQLGIGDGHQFVAQRATASESICLAALRAAGVDIE